MIKPIDPTSCRLETLIAALLYMMTAYQRHSCPNLALSIAAHLECLAHHPDIADSVRPVASGMSDVWKRAPAAPDNAAAMLSRSVH